jgi:hypothetical protein
MNYIILGEYNRFSESKIIFNQRAPIKIIEYNPLWLYEMDDENINGDNSDENDSSGNHDKRDNRNRISSSGSDSSSNHQNPKLSHERRLNILTRHHIFPRGSFILKGIVNRKEYFVVLNFESYTTFLPKNLKKEQEFEIIFYEDENDNRDEKICNYPLEYYLDTGHRRKYNKINEMNVNKMRNSNKTINEKHQHRSSKLRNCLKSIVLFNVKENSFFTKNDIDYNILYNSPSDNIIMLGKISSTVLLLLMLLTIL